jgi:hypothetical protein
MQGNQAIRQGRERETLPGCGQNNETDHDWQGFQQPSQSVGLWVDAAYDEH